MAKTKDGWIRCSKREPCPICEHGDWCTISPDGHFACCMRVESNWPVKNGGYIHKLTDDTSQPPRVPRPVSQPPPRVRQVDFEGMMAWYKSITEPAAVREHAESLGVSSESVYRLGIAYAGPHKAWAFPMRDEAATVIGIRLRAENGNKWAVAGSRQGLFIPDGQMGQEVLICEGPTDTAAMLDLGFYALGRPACNGCEEMLAKMLRGLAVVIVGDRDTPKSRPDGSTWLPGKEGAEKLAMKLLADGARSVKVVYPLKGKDARAWLKAGATHEVVQTVINNALLWRPQ